MQTSREMGYRNAVVLVFESPGLAQAAKEVAQQAREEVEQLKQEVKDKEGLNKGITLLWGDMRDK